MVLGRDRHQAAVADPHDRRGTGIVAVGLVGALVVEDPHPSRQLRRHIQHRLADRDELLRHQRPQSSSAFDRPDPRDIGSRELQQAVALMTIRTDAQLVEQHLVFV